MFAEQTSNLLIGWQSQNWAAWQQRSSG